MPLTWLLRKPWESASSTLQVKPTGVWARLPYLRELLINQPMGVGPDATENSLAKEAVAVRLDILWREAEFIQEECKKRGRDLSFMAAIREAASALHKKAPPVYYLLGLSQKEANASLNEHGEPFFCSVKEAALDTLPAWFSSRGLVQHGAKTFLRSRPVMITQKLSSRKP